MPAVVDIRLLGDKKLERLLRKLEPRVQKKVIRSAMRKAAKPVLARAKTLVPVRTGKRSGPLIRGMKIKSLKRSRFRVGVLLQTPTREELGLSADDKYYYPSAIELGTSKTPAHPFFRNAMDQMRDVSMAIVRREIGNGIIREALRG